MGFGQSVAWSGNGTVRRSHTTSLDWLKRFSYLSTTEKGEIETCIHGCYPARCEEGKCDTNCLIELEDSLSKVYLTHTVCTLLFILIPIAYVKFKVLMEFRRVKQKHEEDQSSDDEEVSGPTDHEVSYTLLQFQAKCATVAPYQNGSWGGSMMEDFIELAVGFAMLTCFGVVLPFMGVLAFFSHIVEYRLMAYRMLNVTCRPFPAAADGIGVWADILRNIAALAVVTNVAVAVFAMYPMRDWNFRQQLIAFLVLEHSMLVLRRIVVSFVDKEPALYKRVDDYNTRFVCGVDDEMDQQKEFQPAPVKAEALDTMLGPDFESLDASLSKLDWDVGLRRRINKRNSS